MVAPWREGLSCIIYIYRSWCYIAVVDLLALVSLLFWLKVLREALVAWNIVSKRNPYYGSSSNGDLMWKQSKGEQSLINQGKIEETEETPLPSNLFYLQHEKLVAASRSINSSSKSTPLSLCYPPPPPPTTHPASDTSSWCHTKVAFSYSKRLKTGEVLSTFVNVCPSMWLVSPTSWSRPMTHWNRQDAGPWPLSKTAPIEAVENSFRCSPPKLHQDDFWHTIHHPCIVYLINTSSAAMKWRILV